MLLTDTASVSENIYFLKLTFLLKLLFKTVIVWCPQYLIACKQGKREERSISINNLLDFGFLKYPAFNCVSLPSDILTIFLSFPTSQKQSRNEFPLDNYLAARWCICFSIAHGGQKARGHAKWRMSALEVRSANEMRAFPWTLYSSIDHTIIPSPPSPSPPPCTWLVHKFIWIDFSTACEEF